MDSQPRNGFDGAQSAASRGSNAGAAPWPPSSSRPPSRLAPIVDLRAIAVVLTFLSAVIVGAVKETVTLIVNDPTTGTSISDTGTIKATYFSAYVYFVVANVLVFIYSLISLIITIAKKGGLSPTTSPLPLTISDLAMLILLFSSNGAAAAVAVVSSYGQSRGPGWDKICNIVGKFCGQINASIVLSMLAASAYAVLVLLAVLGAHKRP